MEKGSYVFIPLLFSGYLLMAAVGDRKQDQRNPWSILHSYNNI